jgi:hypothetical protein
VNALAIGFAVCLTLSAFGLMRQPGIPLAGGYASLLVPGNPYAPADRFRLDLVMGHPGSTYVEYHVTAGCGTRARHVLLVLSGDARLTDPRYAPSASTVTSERTAELSRPWFPVPVRAEVFGIPVQRMPCPRGVSPGQIGSVVSVGGRLRRPFDVSANSAYALQLPVIGDKVSADAYAGSLGGYWAAPMGLSANAYAGSLPLYGRIDTRHDVSGHGELIDGQPRGDGDQVGPRRASGRRSRTAAAATASSPRTGRLASFAAERDRQARHDEGGEPGGPDSGSVAAELGDLAIVGLEGLDPAGVPAPADLQGVTAGVDRRIDRLVPLDRPDALAVDQDVERAAAQLDTE